MRARHRRPLLVLLAAYTGLALGYHLVVPLCESPDAIWHYAYVAHLARGGGLPNRADQGLEAPWRQQGSQPPLYYLVAAPLVAMVDPADEADVMRFNPHAAVGTASAAGNINRMVHTHREAFPWRGTALAAHLIGLLGIGMGAVAVVATYLAAQAALPKRPTVALAAATILALNPQFVFLSGAIGNDVAVTAAAALCWWRLMVLVRHGPGPRNCLLLGVTFGLAALAKLGGLWLLPAIALAVVWSTRPGAGPRLAPWLAAAAKRLAWFSMPAAVVAGWWFVRNFLVFGDPSGLPVMLSVMQPRPVPPTGRELARQMVGVWKSYWAVFGWFNLPAPDWVYAAMNAMCALALGGLGLLLLGSWQSLRVAPAPAGPRQDPPGARGARRSASCPPATVSARLDRAALMALAVAATAVLSLVVALILWARLRYPQGRLLFPAAPAFSLLVGSGLVAGLPDRWGMRLALALAGCLTALALGLLLFVVRPAYQPQVLVEGIAAGVTDLRTPSVTWGSSASPVSTRDKAPENLPTGAASPAALRGWKRLTVAVGSLPSQPLALFGQSLALLEAEVKGQRAKDASGALPVHPGEIIAVRLLWAARQPMATDYSVFLHLVDANGLVLAQHDSYPQSGLAPTSEWWPALPDACAAAPAGHPDDRPLTVAALSPDGCDSVGARLAYPDEHRLSIPATVGVAGSGRLILGVYDWASGERLMTELGSDHLELSPVAITTVSGVDGIPNPLQVRFGDSIRLVGFELDRRVVKPGRKLHLVLYWRPEQRLASDYKVSLQLRRGQAETWGQTDEEPDDSRRPTSGWAPGELIRDYHSIEVYQQAPPGAYELFLKLYDPRVGRALLVDDRNTELSFGTFLVSGDDTTP